MNLKPSTWVYDLVVPVSIAAIISLPDCGIAGPTEGNKPNDHGMAVTFTPSTIKWSQGPPSLPPGAKLTILHGDLTKPEPYTLRIKVSDGYRVPPHWHPDDENITVLKGAVMMGMGEKIDKSAVTELPTGSYFLLPKGEKHYIWSKGETILQIHGTGPWGITYVNPADDPRKKRK